MDVLGIAKIMYQEDTDLIRELISSALQQNSTIQVAYGRGSNPGAERSLQLIRIIDNDLFEALQVAPEQRAMKQQYRCSAMLWVQIGNLRIVNRNAQERFAGLISHHKKQQVMLSEVQAIEEHFDAPLPHTIKLIKKGLYEWQYDASKPSIRLVAPSGSMLNAFTRRIREVAFEDRGGRGWVIIDAMLKYQIDWPAWYYYRMHLTRQLAKLEHSSDKFNSRHNMVTGWHQSEDINLADFLTSKSNSLAPLYDAYIGIPYDLLLKYFHGIRSQKRQYWQSELNFSHEQKLSLYKYQMAEPPSANEVLMKIRVADAKRILARVWSDMPKMKRDEIIVALRERMPSDVRIEQWLRQEVHINATTLRAPKDLSWEHMHSLRRQLRNIGYTLLDHLQGETTRSTIAYQLLNK